MGEQANDYLAKKATAASSAKAVDYVKGAVEEWGEQQQYVELLDVLKDELAAQTGTPRGTGKGAQGSAADGAAKGGDGPRREPSNITPMGVKSGSFGSPHVRPMGVHRTCR